MQELQVALFSFLRVVAVFFFVVVVVLLFGCCNCVVVVVVLVSFHLVLLLLLLFCRCCFCDKAVLLWLSSLSFMSLFLFLDAPSHLYKRSCPSVGPSHVIFEGKKNAY